MRESQKFSKQNDETIVLEEDENEIESFSDLFYDSYGINSSLNNIVEKVEINEAIKEIQEKLKGKIRELKKNNWSLLGTLIGFFAAAPLVILLSSVIDSPAMLGFSMILFSGLLVFYRIFQLGRKEKTLIQEIDNLVRKMLEEELDGKLIGDPILSVKWNLVKVQQNNKIVEYVVRIIVDENDNESFEIRELK